MVQRFVFYETFGWDYWTYMAQPHAEIEALEIVLEERARFRFEQHEKALKEAGYNTYDDSAPAGMEEVIPGGGAGMVQDADGFWRKAG